MMMCWRVTSGKVAAAVAAGHALCMCHSCWHAQEWCSRLVASRATAAVALAPRRFSNWVYLHHVAEARYCCIPVRGGGLMARSNRPCVDCPPLRQGLTLIVGPICTRSILAHGVTGVSAAERVFLARRGSSSRRAGGNRDSRLCFRCSTRLSSKILDY